MSLSDFVILKDLRHAEVGGFQPNMLENWIREGKATFFVGAAVSVNDASSTAIAALQQIGAALDRLKIRFGTDEVAIGFLDAFRQAYLPARRTARDSEGAPQPPAETGVSTSDGTNIEKLRTSLVALVTALTRLFNKESSAHRYYFAGRPRGLKLNASKHEDVFEALTKTLEIARMIGTKDATTKWGEPLVAGLHYEICSWIALHVSKTECEKQDEWQDDFGVFAEIRELLKLLSNDEVGKTPLTEGDLEWLSDLLWLILRIDLPLYPSSHELAIELGVSSKTLFPPTPILSKSAETIAQYDDVYKFISDRIRMSVNGRTTGPEPTDAHFVLAATLMHMSERTMARAPDGSSGHGKARAQKPSLPSLLLTTNFDSGVEEAIERVIKARLPDRREGEPAGYRAVFPILVRRRIAEADGPRYIRWVVKDWEVNSRNEKSVKHRIIVPKEENQSGDDSLHEWKAAIEVRPFPEDVDLLAGAPGPVIVKLHGSPLEPLEAIDDENIVCSPYVVASEYHYVSALTNQTYALPFFYKLFITDRNLIFMGYSLGDWNIRVSLAQQAQKAAQSSARAEPQMRLAIVKERNLGDVALFHRLGVATMQDDIRNVITKFARFEFVRPFLPPKICDHLLPRATARQSHPGQ